MTKNDCHLLSVDEVILKSGASVHVNEVLVELQAVFTL